MKVTSQMWIVPPSVAYLILVDLDGIVMRERQVFDS